MRGTSALVQRSMRRLLALAFLLALPSTAGAQALPPIAITIDDLPYVGPLRPGDTREAAIPRIIDAAQAAHAPLTGFVTCGNIWEGETDLGAWIARSVPLANHSWSHRSLDALGLPAWRRDIARCQRRLERATGSEIIYFRDPYLRMGRDRRLRDGSARWLAAQGLTRATVSIDTSDWVLAPRYVEAIARGDDGARDAIVRAYVEHVRRSSHHHAELARGLGHPSAPLVLLLHANALAADHLGDVLAALASDGARFVSLAEALADPFYAREERYVGGIGLAWTLRTADAAADGWRWDEAQASALAVRFGGASEESSFRIGPEQSVRRVGDDAWVVTDHVPFDAHQLLVRMRDGTLVLMHTPWTDAGSRVLLDWVHARFGEDAPLVAIAGHFHNDAVGGARALVAAGARWIGSDHTARLVRERGAAMGRGMMDVLADRPELAARFAGYDPLPPLETFAEREGLELRFGEESVRVLFPGATHSPDLVVVHFPSRGILFAGCGVVGMERFGYLGDADLASWPAAIERMRALGAHTIVVGHGERTDPGMLDHTLALIREEVARRAAAD